MKLCLFLAEHRSVESEDTGAKGLNSTRRSLGVVLYFHPDGGKFKTTNALFPRGFLMVFGLQMAVRGPVY